MLPDDSLFRETAFCECCGGQFHAFSQFIILKQRWLNRFTIWGTEDIKGQSDFYRSDYHLMDSMRRLYHRLRPQGVQQEKVVLKPT